MKKLLTLCVSISLSLLCVLLLTNQAHAASFTVTDTSDDSAVDPSVSCDTAGNVCTLRSAIEAANAQAGADMIYFNISGGGVHSLSPQSPFNISEQVTIDGSSQPGASCGTLVPQSLPSSNTPHVLLIEIDGTNAIDGYGGGVIQFTNAGASSSVIKGLVMNRATASSGFAIHYGVNDINDITIECNYIGTNTAGATTSPNANGIGSFDGFDITGLTIQNNLISGNTESNITINGSGSTNNMIIQDNLIGTSNSGELAIGTTANPAVNLFQLDTIQVNHNIISGNTGAGASISNSQNITFQGNYVGVNIIGEPLGNGSDGVVFYATLNTIVGGTSLTNRNIISANTGDGIHMYRDCSAQNGSNNSTTFNNYIGTTTSGAVQTGYGNSAAGIEVNEYYGGCVSVYKHQIGGDEPGQANIIAGNTNQGIIIHQSSGQDVFSISTFGNSIYNNGQFGIDLAGDSDQNSGIADTDLGPNVLNDLLMSYPTALANYYINRPTINSTSYVGNQLTINYDFQANQADNSTLFQTNVAGYRLDFYLNDAGNDGGYDGYSQGKTYIGSFIVDGSETNATHIFMSPTELINGQAVTATTTLLWKNIPQTVCSDPDTYYGDGPPYLSCTPPQP